MNRKLKKALRELYASEQPEHMQSFLEQLPKKQKNIFPAVTKFMSPVIAIFILSIITSYSYIIYKNHYQPYEQLPETIPTEYIILESESKSETELASSATEQNFLISTTETISNIHTKIATTTITTITELTEITSQTSILSEIETTTTIVPEPATDITDSLPEIITSEQPEYTISEPKFTIPTETETTTIQNTILIPTRQEICNLFAQKVTLTELMEQFHLEILDNTDTIYAITAQSLDIPDMLFLFRNSGDEYILDAITAPTSILLPELSNQSVSEAKNFLNAYCLENNNYCYLLENNTAIYDFSNLQKSDILSNQNITIMNPELTNYHIISNFAEIFQSQYFALYHPEIQDYALSMNENDYKNIENLFAEIKNYIPQNHECYEDWLLIESGSVKQNHNSVNSYDTARIYWEYISYTLLITKISEKLEKQLPEDIYASIKLSNQNWANMQNDFLENVIPYHADEAYAEVVCFEAESAKCRALILMMYLQT